MDFGKLKLGIENLNLLSFLVKTQDELDDFMLGFWSGEKSQGMSILNYRLHKIKEIDVSLEEFCSLFIQRLDRTELAKHINSNGLEVLFMQPISSDVTSAILNKINNGELTLENIYSTFKDNVGMNATRFAHKSNNRKKRFI